MFLAYSAAVAALILLPSKSQPLMVEVVYAQWTEKDETATEAIPRSYRATCTLYLSIAGVGESANAGLGSDLTKIHVQASLKERHKDYVLANVRIGATTSKKGLSHEMPITSTTESLVRLDMKKWTVLARDNTAGSIKGFLIRILDSGSPKP